MDVRMMTGSRRPLGPARPVSTLEARLQPTPRRWPGVLTGMALGAWMLAWGGAAEAQEPSLAGGAPSAVAVTAAVPAMAAPTALAPSPLALPAPDLLAVAGNDGEDGYGRGYGRGGYDGDGYGRRRPWRRAQRRTWHREPTGWIQVRGGVFDTEDVDKNDWLAGAKVTGVVGHYLRLGVAADFQRRTDAISQRVDRTVDATGNTIETTVTTFDASSNLIPIMGVLEVHPGAGYLHPYLGIGAGYEALVVDSRDFVSGVEFNDNYGGFGWQPYGGLEIPLAPNVAINAEAFGNFATVKRTLQDFESGAEVREEIKLNGVGVRAGVAFGF